MSKTPKHHHQEWTPDQDRQLRELVRHNTPTPLIAYKLGRTEAAVRTHASEEGISLKPTNQSPYGTQRN
jgi:hypothetical protein